MGEIEALQPVSNTYPRLSPDNHHLLYSSENEGSLNIYPMSQDTKDVKMLTHWQYDDSSAAWSPDGQKLGWRRTLTDKNGKRNFEVFAKD
ncbi:MAG: hypothetical protein GY780_15935 [bacterium]|nr:hypothetical protein [bacterium]